LGELNNVLELEDTIHLRNRLKSWTDNSRDLFIDLRSTVYTATPEDSYIEFSDKSFYDRRLYFKTDPESPKDPKVIHAEKQLCKLLGVPHTFFASNRPSLKMNIVKTWQAGLTANEAKAQSVMKIRESPDCSIIRAFVSPSKCVVPLFELIDIVMQSVSTPVTIEFVHGDEKDDLVLHVRFLFDKEYRLFANEEPVCLGFSLVASELDASPLILDVLLHDKTHKTSYIAAYGGDPFFKSKHEGIKATQIKDVLAKMLDRIDNEAPQMIAAITGKVSGSSEEYFYPEEELVDLLKTRGMSSKIRRAIYQQISECSEDIKTPWDLARHVSLVAKDQDFLKRLDVERAAGRYLNLMFGKD